MKRLLMMSWYVVKAAFYTFVKNDKPKSFDALIEFEEWDKGRNKR